MKDFAYYLECLDQLDEEQQAKCQRQPIRIAVLDTGIHLDERDRVLEGGKERIVLKRSFLGDDDAHLDENGHGTHVVRLLLRFAPNAEIAIAKVSKDKSFTTTRLSQIVKVRC